MRLHQAAAAWPEATLDEGRFSHLQKRFITRERQAGYSRLLARDDVVRAVPPREVTTSGPRGVLTRLFRGLSLGQQRAINHK